MTKRMWLVIPLAALAVWYGPARLVRRVLARPAPPAQVQVQHPHECTEAARPGEGDSAEVRVERTQALAPGASVELENVSGDIRVRPAPAGDNRAHLVAVISGDDDDERGAVSPARVAIDADEHHLHARVVDGPGRRGVEVTYTLELPAGAALSLRTVSGDMQITGASGPVEVHSVSGDASLDGVAGRLALQTVSGDISGSLATGCAGGEVRSVSGDVDLQAGRGLSVRASTLSGDVDNDLGAGGGATLRIATTSGDIRVRGH